MVAATNTAYRDGGVNQRIQAVAVEEVAYTEGTSETDLSRLHAPRDGYMDEVHAVRDRLGADIVLLIRRANAGTVSRAYLMTPVSLAHASFAFGVVANIGGARHFAHELGHIMGLNHDRFVSCESGSCDAAAFPYAYGYVNQPGLRPGASSSKPWLTIMAYTNQCTGNAVTCQQLMRFSNPDQTYQGDPLGIAGLAPSNSWTNGPSDAVRALNRTRGYVANFRQPPPDITVSFGAEAYEATEAGTGANVRLELSAAPTRPIDIPLTLTATGATAYDYTGVPAAVHFDADDTAQTFTVRAPNDTADDDGESVTLTLGAPLPAKVTAVSPSQTTVTLTDNDPDPGEPSILSVELTSDPRWDAPYTIGDEIEVSVRFTKTVTVTGAPQLTLTMGTETREATYRDSAGEVVRFVYTVVEGDRAANGVSIAANSLSDDGTIRDSDNRDAVRTHDEVAADENHRVDGTRPELRSAEVNFTELTLIYDEALDETSVPAASAFWVRVGGARFNVTSVAVRGKKVTLTLSRSVPHDENGALISYTAGSGLRDPLGNPAAPLSNHSVTNVASSYDSDEDGDGLLEITNLAQLDAMRYDLDGDGTPSASGETAYNDAFPDFASPLRCPSSGCSGYELSTDLDFDTNRNGMADADDAYWNNGAGWNPIGHSSADGFAATFKGNGHTIANLYINRTSVSNNAPTNSALFAKSSSTIRNVGLVNVDVTVTARRTGARQAHRASALVGTNTGTIRACYATGRVEGPTAGGLVGGNQGTIRTSYAAVRVRSGNDYSAGGLTTSNSSGTIRDSYATGTVVSDGSSSSGLATVNTDKIRDSYATGLVSGDSLSGGLVGANYGSGTITASYWDTDTSGQTTIAGGATGQTTTALQTPTGATGIYSTWDTDRWHFGTTSQYPVLKADFDGDGTATWQEFGYQLRAGPALTVTTAAGQVGLEWTAVDTAHWDPAPAVTYTVYRNDGTTIETVAEELNGSFYNDLGVPVGAYTYQVAAVVNGGEATRSGLVAVTVTAVPEAPGNLEVSASDGGKLSVSWEPPESDGGASIDSYMVQWKSRSQEYDTSRRAEVTDLTDLSYTIDGLIHGGAYTVQVWAFNINGAGTAAEATATAENVAEVSFAQGSYAVSEGGTTRVGVRLNKDPQRTVAIPLVATPQDGAEPADYEPPQDVTFSAGEIVKEITVTATDDDIDDDGESVRLGFGSRPPDGVTVGSPDTVTIAILDNDDPWVRVSFVQTSYTATEGETGVTVAVTLDQDPERTVRIPLTTSPQDGATAADYTLPASVTFNGDETLKEITVTATDDAIDDDRESVQLGFGSPLPDRVTTTGGLATVTLADNDERGVTVSPTALDVPENGSKTYTVVLTSEPIDEVMVMVEVPAGRDVSVDKTSLRFTPSNWNRPQDVTVDADDDTDAVADPPVTLRHTVSGGDYEEVSADAVQVTIIEQDAPTLTMASQRAAEGAGEMVFEVELSVESSEAVTVDYATANGTAKAGQDYKAQNGTLTFPANNTTARTVTVSLIDDLTDDTVEEKRFTVELRNAEHATLAGGGTSLTATGTITDDDEPEVEVSFGAAHYTVNEGKHVEVTVGLSADPERRVEILLIPTLGDNVEESDYTGVPDAVVFESGDRERPFSFIASADQVNEEAKTVTLDLDLGELPPAGVHLGSRATTVVTIAAPTSPPPSPPSPPPGPPSGGPPTDAPPGEPEPGPEPDPDPEPVGVLEIPGPGSRQSGIGLLSGWVCEADVVTLEIVDGPRIAAAYGTDRADTATVCGNQDNGFGLLFNWNLLGDGVHTVRALADGVEFGRAMFTVTTLDEEFVADADGETVVEDFPSDGETVRLVWQAANQNFVLAPLDRGPPPASPPGPQDGPLGTLENPGPASFQSGIGLLSGWVCEADVVELEINGGPRIAAAYGTDRADTMDVCGDPDNGFGLLFNWNLLGDGVHTVVAVADGEEVGRATFTVTTLGMEFLQGMQGEAVVTDFPSAGEEVRLIWQQANQNFVLAPLR